MNRAELKMRIEVLGDIVERELNHLRSIKIHCQSCEHYRFSNGPECDKWKTNPPPEIVRQGCEEWTYDFVPF